MHSPNDILFRIALVRLNKWLIGENGREARVAFEITQPVRFRKISPVVDEALVSYDFNFGKRELLNLDYFHVL
jgi:hypothetical protein